MAATRYAQMNYLWPRILLTLGLVSGPAFADQAGTEAQDGSRIFGEEIDVRVINLEVRVTDRRGQHLAGLTPGDFTLRIDGQAHPIDYFSEIRERQAVAPSDASATESVSPAITPGERVRTSFLLFVDHAFGYPHDREQVLDALAKTVHSLEPGDEMAIVSFNGQRLIEIIDWTDSPEALQEALDQALTAPSAGVQHIAEERALDRRRQLLGAAASSGGSGSTEAFIRDLSRKIRRAAQAASSALRGFAAPTGRKVMLLASGGWPRDPSIYAVGFNPTVRSQTRSAFPTDAFEELIDTANLLGYTIYPIDVPGNKVGVRGISAENRGPSLPGGDLLESGTPRRRDSSPEVSFTAADVLTGPLGIDSATNRELENEATLLELAQRTGGRALINSQRLVALEEVLADTASYYWLGFTQDRRRDDQEHEIEILVAQPGAKVRSRRGFRDMSQQHEVSMEIERHLLLGSEVGEELLQVELGRPRVRRKVRQPLVLRVPLDHILMVPNASGYASQLELRVASIDVNGGRSPLPSEPVRIAGPELPQPGQVAVVDVVVQLSNVRQKLLLALHDLAGGAVLKATVDYQPPAP